MDASFGSANVNIFRQLLGLEEVKCGDEYLVTKNLVGKDDDGSMNETYN